MDTQRNVPISQLIKKNIKIGDLLLEEKIINQDQLDSAINIHKSKSSDNAIGITNTLVMLGYLSKDALNKAMLQCFEETGDLKDLLMKRALVSPVQIQKAREAQEKNGTSLGDELISLGYIAEGLFYNLFKKEVRPSILTQFLIDHSVISDEQLRRAERINRMGFRLGEILISEGIVTDAELKMILSLQYNTPFKRLNEYCIDEEDKKVLTEIIRSNVASRYTALPYSVCGEDVEVVLNDLNFIDEIKNLEKTSGYNFLVCISLDSDFKLLYYDLYGNVFGQVESQAQLKQENLVKDEDFSLKGEHEFNEPEVKAQKRKENLFIEEGKGADKGNNVFKSYPSDFFRSYALYIKSYFNALENAGFSEEQAIKIVGKENGIKYSGIPGEKKRTKNLSEFFSIIMSDPKDEEEAIGELFQNYIKAKISCGENTNKIIKREGFAEFVTQNIIKIKELKNCNSTRCSIIIKNNTAKILVIEN